MNKKSLAYSGVLFLALLVTSILLSQGVIHGAIASADVTLVG